MKDPSVDINQEFENQKNARIYDGPAKRLKEKLAPLKSHIDKYQRRWFWELLQNACDYNDNVEIELSLTQDRIVFKHNGDPFSMEDALNLVFPDSSKDDNTDKRVIGQFGTGFLSTHILSGCIAVEGQIESEQHKIYDFRFNLDRSDWENRQFLSDSLRISEGELKNFNPATQKKFSTSFTYEAKNTYPFVDFEETRKNGVKFINTTLPYIFAFVKKLRKVDITTPEFRYSFTASSVDGITEMEKIKTDISSGEKVEETLIKVYTATVENTTVACLVSAGVVNAHKKNQAKLFCAYPLIGSEAFPFPVVLNSLAFSPRSERDGVELSENDKANRAVLVNGLEAYQKLIERLQADDIKGVFHIIRLGKLSFSETIQKWFEQNIRLKLRDIIKEKIMVGLSYGATAPFKNILFPFIEKEELLDDYYNFINRINWCIPDAAELKYWIENINFSVFTLQRLNFDKLFSIYREQNKFPHLFLRENVNHEQWYYDGLKLLIDAEKISLLQKNKFIPMQEGSIKSLEEEIYWDDEIEDELKEIYKLLHSTDYKSILVAKNIDFGDKLLSKEKTKTQKDIRESIDDAFETIVDSSNCNFLSAFEKLMNFTDGMSEDDIANKFPRFYAKRGPLVMETFTSDDKRRMAFKIVTSGKLDALSRLAGTDLTSYQIEQITENSAEFKQYLEWKNNFVDDEENADEDLGDIGEKIVLEKLKANFPEATGYEVEWVAKTRQEPNYDFEIRHNGKIKLFVDAKTTGKGLANTGTVPFFMRIGQWKFLPTIGDEQKYVIARVFFNDHKPDVRFINVELSSFQ